MTITSETRERKATFKQTPYPDYEESGVDWLGSLPSHWETKRLKHTARFVGGGTPSKDNLAFWSGSIPWVSPKDMKAEFIHDTEDHVTEDAVRESATRVVEAGAVLVVVRSGILRHSIPVAINMLPVTLNQDMKAIVPSTMLDTRYLVHLIRGNQRELLFKWRKEGATVESIEHDLLADTSIPLPPLAEQRAIATFLDRETATIDALIAKKERLIELLREKRAALISHAVTHGLDPNAPMKDTGVEWLGEIPANWNCFMLRRAVTSMCDGPFGSDMKSSHYSDDGVRLIRLQNIGTGVFNDADKAFIPQEHFDSLPGHDAKSGDILVAGLGDLNHPVGRACLLPGYVGTAMVKADCFRVRLDQRRVIHSFAAYFLNSSIARAGVAIQMRGATRDRMNLTGLSALDIPVPPLDEQIAIVAMLERTTESITTLITHVQQHIETLRERRTALVSAAVTGQIDVREGPDNHVESSESG